MKKSDALFKIQSILDTLDGVCTNKVKSLAILHELQSVGMLPPRITRMQKYTRNGQLLELIVNENEWENE